jgi:uncharacterized protein (DUF488 family)
MMHNLQTRTCFTIGHGNYPIDLFIDTVRSAGIDTIIDVRSSPYSRFNPQFNRKSLEKSLKERAIGYLFMGDRLGGRYSDPGLLFPDGTVDYRKVQETERFKEGIGRLLAIISGNKTIALMCAEKEPERCHRFALISPVLQSNGVAVIHVRPDMKLQANEDLEKELINSIIDTKQTNISGEPVNSVDLIYEKLNKKLHTKHRITEK